MAQSSIFFRPLSRAAARSSPFGAGRLSNEKPGARASGCPPARRGAETRYVGQPALTHAGERSPPESRVTVVKDSRRRIAEGSKAVVLAPVSRLPFAYARRARRRAGADERW